MTEDAENLLKIEQFEARVEKIDKAYGLVPEPFTDEYRQMILQTLCFTGRTMDEVLEELWNVYIHSVRKRLYGQYRRED